MARNRQRAKQRQAERRAERLRAGGGSAAPARADERPDDAAAAGRDPVERAEVEVGAPPPTVGRSDTVVAERAERAERAEPPAAEPHGLEDDDYASPSDAAAAPARAPGHHERGRLTAFLAAVVAELRRVQWPDRTAVTTLTGIVLGFVVVAGGYLGLLDLVFSRLMRAIL